MRRRSRATRMVRYQSHTTGVDSASAQPLSSSFKHAQTTCRTACATFVPTLPGAWSVWYLRRKNSDLLAGSSSPGGLPVEKSRRVSDVPGGSGRDDQHQTVDSQVA